MIQNTFLPGYKDTKKFSLSLKHPYIRTKRKQVSCFKDIKLLTNTIHNLKNAHYWGERVGGDIFKI